MTKPPENNLSGAFNWRNAPRYQRDNPVQLRVLDDLEARLQLFNLLDTPVWVFDAEHCQCLWANVSGLEIWRAASVTDLQRRDLAGTQSDAIYALVNNHLRRVMRGEKIREWVTLKVGENTRRFSHSYHHLTLVDERNVLLIEAKAAPAAEEMLAFAADYTLTVGLYELDGQLLSSNPALQKLAQHQSMQDLNRLLPADISATDWPQKIAEQSHLRFEMALETGRGVGQFRAELRRVFNHAGQPRVILTLDNITEQRIKESELALQDHRARTERLLDSAEVATFVWDLERRLVTVDHRWWSMLGYELEEFRLDEAVWQSLVHPEDAPRVLHETRRVRDGEVTHWNDEYRLRRKDGTFVWVLDRGVVTRRDLTGRPVELGGIHLDIHQKKAVELALAGAEMRQRALLGALPDLLCVSDLEGKVVDLHAAQPMDWGLPTTRGVGRNLSELLAPEVVARLRPAQEQVLATGRLLQGEFQITHPRLGERHREFRMVPYGENLTLVLVRDVTDRYLAETQRQQALAQLQQSQKMDALGQLAGGIAHDFNNILASMLGYAWLAKQIPAVALDKNASEYLETITAAGERGRELVQKLLTFSRPNVDAEVQSIDPRPVIEEAFGMLKAVMPPHIDLELALPASCPALLINPTDVHQIVVNLVVNSRDAMHSHGKITISLTVAKNSQPACASCHAKVVGPHLSLAVRDTGSGIPPELLNRIFDPFFTTKAVGVGTGLGLSTVSTLVHRHAGHLLVTSQPGQGTLIEILWPCEEAANVSPPTVEVLASEAPAGGGHLMVVDDEPWVGVFLQKLLEDNGYSADVFDDGKSALAAITLAPKRYVAVLTDLNMQDMAGLELAASIHRSYPSVPIWLCTGVGDLPSAAKLAEAGILQVLPKPIPIHSLRALLSKLAVAPTLTSE